MKDKYTINIDNIGIILIWPRREEQDDKYWLIYWIFWIFWPNLQNSSNIGQSLAANWDWDLADWELKVTTNICNLSTIVLWQWPDSNCQINWGIPLIIWQLQSGRCQNEIGIKLKEITFISFWPPADWKESRITLIYLHFILAAVRMKWR